MSGVRYFGAVSFLAGDDVACAEGGGAAQREQTYVGGSGGGDAVGVDVKGGDGRVLAVHQAGGEVLLVGRGIDGEASPAAGGDGHRPKAVPLPMAFHEIPQSDALSTRRLR